MSAVQICITTGDLFSRCFGKFYSSVGVRVSSRDWLLATTQLPNQVTGRAEKGPEWWNRDDIP